MGKSLEAFFNSDINNLRHHFHVFFVFTVSETLVYVGSTCLSYVALNRMMTTMEAMFTIASFSQVRCRSLCCYESSYIYRLHKQTSLISLAAHFCIKEL